ncbi:MAG: hypothetical protein CL489_06615 [Acidobacteria bacterium]|nr:hypothetical protein [Acidobacteriota bacterium]
MGLEPAWSFLKALPEQQRFRVRPYTEHPWDWSQLDPDVNEYREEGPSPNRSRWSRVGGGGGERYYESANQAQRLGTIHPAIMGLLDRLEGEHRSHRVPRKLGTPKKKTGHGSQESQEQEVVQSGGHSDEPKMRIVGVRSDEDMSGYGYGASPGYHRVVDEREDPYGIASY